jgi:CheY-like chemotaxis protein
LRRWRQEVTGMSARLALMIRWAALAVLVLAIVLIIARWRLPMREHRSRSTLDILRALWTRLRERREDAREHAVDVAALRDRTALIVGPEDKGLRVIRWKLEALKCKVIRARTGTHALAVARDEKPDVIVADALLPDMSAADFYQSLADADVPVAFVGVLGHQWDELHKLGRSVTCAGRPFDPEEVAAALGYMLRRAI